MTGLRCAPVPIPDRLYRAMRACTPLSSCISRSLPVGVLIGLLMAFYVKPRLDRMMQAARD
jgi:hypothetical protein